MATTNSQVNSDSYRSAWMLYS